jgi:hypothetical protein
MRVTINREQAGPKLARAFAGTATACVDDCREAEKADAVIAVSARPLGLRVRGPAAAWGGPIDGLTALFEPVRLLYLYAEGGSEPA